MSRPQQPLTDDGARVVVIGVGDYESDDVANIPSAITSADDFTKTLSEQCSVSTANIRTLRNPTSGFEIGEQVEAACREATSALLIYFVGHGLVRDNGELYLANSSSLKEPTRIAYTALPFSAIKESIIASGARSVCVILDCCFAGRAAGILGDDADVTEGTRVEGACVLAAAARDEFAIAPAGSVHTAFTGEIISYLREGNADDGPWITIKDVFRRITLALSARGLPRPRLLVQQNISDLTLCPNPARAGVAVNDTITTVATPTPSANPSIDSSAPDAPRLGEILSYEGSWPDFNPLPRALMETDSRVPRTSEDFDELTADHPPNWEARLFAGTALRELGRLRPEFARHFRGPVNWNGRQIGGQEAYSFIRGKLDPMGQIVERLNDVLGENHDLILQSENEDAIAAHAVKLTRTLELFMELSEELRSTSISNRHLRRAANILAHFPDQAIVATTEVIHQYVSALDDSGRRIMAGEDPNITLTASITIPDVLTEMFGDAISRY